MLRLVYNVMYFIICVLGSSQTPTLTTFTIAVFSLLLRYSFLRQSNLIRHTIHTLTSSTSVTPTTPKMGVVENLDFEVNDGNMVKLFLSQLKGEVLDEYAQTMPGMVQQLKVDTAPVASLTTEKAMSKLSIGPVNTWNDGSIGLRIGEEKSEESSGGLGKERKIMKEDGDSKKAAGIENSELVMRKKKENSHDRNRGKKQRPTEKVKKKVMVVNRRRQRRRPGWKATPLTSEDEESEHSDLSQHSSDLGSSSSLSDSQEEESVDMIDSLSETSLSDGEDGGEEREGKNMIPSILNNEQTSVLNSVPHQSTDGGLGDSQVCEAADGNGGDCVVHEKGGPTPRPWTSSVLQEAHERGEESVDDFKDGRSERKEVGKPGKRQIVLAANFGLQNNAPAVRVERKEEEEHRTSTEKDDHLFQVSSKGNVVSVYKHDTHTHIHTIHHVPLCRLSCSRLTIKLPFTWHAVLQQRTHTS